MMLRPGRSTLFPYTTKVRRGRCRRSSGIRTESGGTHDAGTGNGTKDQIQEKEIMSTTLRAMTRPVQLTDRINRIGPSATMAAVAEAEKLRQAGIDVVDMTAGEPPFSNPQHTKKAAI